MDSEINNNDYTIEEYKMLREELMYLIKRHRLFNYIFAIGVSATMVKLFDNFNDLIAIMLMFAMYFLLLLEKWFVDEIVKIGSYMKIILEPQLVTIQWENNLSKFRTKKSNIKNFKFKFDDFILVKSTHIASIIISVYLFICSMSQFEMSCSKILTTIIYIAMLFAYVVEFKDRIRHDVFSHNEKIWLEVRNEIMQSKKQ